MFQRDGIAHASWWRRHDNRNRKLGGHISSAHRKQSKKTGSGAGLSTLTVHPKWWSFSNKVSPSEGSMTVPHKATIWGPNAHRHKGNFIQATTDNVIGTGYLQSYLQVHCHWICFSFTFSSLITDPWGRDHSSSSVFGKMLPVMLTFENRLQLVTKCPKKSAPNTLRVAQS